MVKKTETGKSVAKDELDIEHDCVDPNAESEGGEDSLESMFLLEKNPVKRILTLFGPGLITGASDDDPSGIGTYTTAATTYTWLIEIFSFTLR